MGGHLFFAEVAEVEAISREVLGDLSLTRAILNAFSKHNNAIKTLIDAFDYPRRGPGMMWEAVARRVEDGGGTVNVGTPVARLHRDNHRVTTIEVDEPSATARHHIAVEHVISRIPTTELVAMFHRQPPSIRNWASDRAIRRSLHSNNLVGNGAAPTVNRNTTREASSIRDCDRSRSRRRG